jgi:hypothetical protein
MRGLFTLMFACRGRTPHDDASTSQQTDGLVLANQVGHGLSSMVWQSEFGAARGLPQKERGQDCSWPLVSRTRQAG